jgi:predicted acetyltransferase
MILRELTSFDAPAFETFLDSWEDSSGLSLIYGLIGGLDFNSYVKILNESRDGINLGPQEVPTTSLFAFFDGQIVGKISIRHHLNELLENRGGHVGFGVLSAFRGKGFAKQMLALSLDQCRKIGLKKILLTCEESNDPSIKVITQNGGVLDQLNDPKLSDTKILRFWITL